MRERAGSAALLAAAALAGCFSRPAVAPRPAPEARFVATSGSTEAAARAPASMATADSTPCRLAVHFDGTARASARQLDLALAHAWVAVTRDNDERWDDLHLRVEGRQLFFFVSYHTLGYGGRFAGCDGMASSGPLDFGAPVGDR